MKKLYAIVLTCLIFVLFASAVFPYNTKEKGEGGHVGLAKKSIELKKTKDVGLQKDLSDPNYYDKIINAVSSEDAVFTSEVIPRWMHHFYNPISGKGLPYFKNARERADDFYKGAVNSYCTSDKQKGWEKLGHALHLLQDMGSPSHVGDATHAFQQFFPTWGFENYVSNNWGSLEKEIVAEDCELNGGINDYIQKMSSYTYNNYAKHDREYVTIDPGPPPTINYVPVPVTKGEDPYPNEPYNTIALLNNTVCYSAGLIDTFWNDVYVDKCSPKLFSLSPGGDHPDETYDVSIPLQYDINEADYQWINMRLAMKKGRIGYYWAYLYGNKFQEIYNLPSDTPNEVIAQKFVELKDIEDFLINYPYNETSDTIAAPDVALLENGFSGEAAKFLFKNKETARLIEPQFSFDELKNQPVLVIPSGGLYGMENSIYLKASLSEYVKQGGTLIVFAQQHGYEFSILPVPQEQDGTFKTITGYGWTEDQSCLWNGTYVDTYHQILSAMTTSTVSANVDGYFTSYPSSSTILLRRTANGQPAMIMYDYGMGKVIISSMFSDWGYAHSQATQDEIKIVRDIISWAKAPAQLPEIKPGQSVQVQVEVKNNTTTDATSIKIQIYNPDRATAVSEQQLAVSIPAGSFSQLVTDYSSLITDALGIYHIDYELYDSNGILIQPQAETDTGRFIVSNPPSNPYKSADLLYTINTPSEDVLEGQDVAYTVNIWNRSAYDKRLRLWKNLSHFWQVGFLDEIIVPANGSVSKTYMQKMSGLYDWAFTWATIWVDFYEENSTGTYKPWYIYSSETHPYAYVGTIGKRLKLSYPSVDLLVKPEKSLYDKGETVNLSLTIQNKQNITYTSTLKVRATDPSNTIVNNTSLNITLPANGSTTQNLSFMLPSTAQIGFYTILVEALDASGKKIGMGSSSFEIPQSQISVTPNLPSLTTGSNTIPFLLNNTGRINVNSGVIDVSFKDPNGNIVYSGSQPFSLQVAESKAQSVNISIPSLKFGNYTLTYSQSDETRTGSPTNITIPNSATLALAFDKSSYKIGETAGIVITINDKGKFVQNGTLTIDAPFLGFTDTKNITVNPSNIANIPYAILLPATLISGGNITATFTASGYQLTKTLLLSIAPITINQNIAFDKSSYRIRENLGMNYIVTNNAKPISPLLLMHLSIFPFRI
ncbi:MAG: hypothetical protein HY755_12730 [Nitrospirae bacterium]|nr:hypothetical protein [Nitrospirota bacterium]